METEVKSFLESLGSNLRKADIESLSQKLVSVPAEWITVFQHHLSEGYWTQTPLERQLSILYVLNAYFKDAFKNKADLDVWIDSMEKMLSTLHIKNASNDKEFKHVTKLVTIWGSKERDPKAKISTSKRRLSIFPKESCDKWLGSLAALASACGIKMGPSEAENSNGMLSLLQPGVEVEVTTLEVQHSDVVKSLNNAALVPNRPLKSSSALPTTHSSTTTSTTNNTVNNSTSGAKFTAPKTYPTPLPAAVGSPVDVRTHLHNELVQAICKFQMNVLRCFAYNCTRRLDRWNLNVVVVSSFYLLHRYIAEYGVVDMAAAPLVVACLYLSGKADYLFVKADKLRQIANKYVRDLNEPAIPDSLQVYKYEAELLRMIQFNVGAIPNPLKCLKALDIHEANLTGATSLDPQPLNPPNNAENPPQVPLNPINLSDIGQLKPEVVIAGGGLNQARRLIDDAVELFLSEKFLFSDTLIQVEWNFYLASAVLLEMTQRAFGDEDPRECESKMAKFLLALSGMNPDLRQGCRFSAISAGGSYGTAGGLAPSFMTFLSALHLKTPHTSPVGAPLSEEGEVLSSSETSPLHPALESATVEGVQGSAIFSVSSQCLDSVRRVLPKVEKEVRALEERTRALQSPVRAPVVPPVGQRGAPTSSSYSALPSGGVGAYGLPPYGATSCNSTSAQKNSTRDVDRDRSRDTRDLRSEEVGRGNKRGRDSRDRERDTDRGKERDTNREWDRGGERGGERDKIRDRRSQDRHAQDQLQQQASKKKRWDTYGEPDRGHDRHPEDGHRRDIREVYDRRGDRESRDHREWETYDEMYRGAARVRDRDRDRGRADDHQREREYQAYDRPPPPQTYPPPPPQLSIPASTVRIEERNQYGALVAPDSSGKGRDRGGRRDGDRASDRGRERSPARGAPSFYSASQPPPPLSVPPTSSSYHNTSNSTNTSAGKRRRSGSRSPPSSKRHAPLPYQPPPPSAAPPLPAAPPPPSTRYPEASSGRDRDRDRHAGEVMARFNRDVVYATSHITGTSNRRDAHTVRSTTSRQEKMVEDGELSDGGSDFCQFIGISNPTSTAPTPYIASAPPPPRVLPSQSTTQLWIPGGGSDEEVDSPVVRVPSLQTLSQIRVQGGVKVVDLTKASPIVNTSAVHVPNLSMLANLSRSGAGASASAGVSPRAVPPLVQPPVVPVVPPVVPSLPQPEHAVQVQVPEPPQVPLVVPTVPVVPVVLLPAVAVNAGAEQDSYSGGSTGSVGEVAKALLAGEKKADVSASASAANSPTTTGGSDSCTKRSTEVKAPVVEEVVVSTARASAGNDEGAANTTFTTTLASPEAITTAPPNTTSATGNAKSVDDTVQPVAVQEVPAPALAVPRVPPPPLVVPPCPTSAGDSTIDSSSSSVAAINADTSGINISAGSVEATDASIFKGMNDQQALSEKGVIAGADTSKTTRDAVIATNSAPAALAHNSTGRTSSDASHAAGASAYSSTGSTISTSTATTATTTATTSTSGKKIVTIPPLQSTHSVSTSGTDPTTSTTNPTTGAAATAANTGTSTRFSASGTSVGAGSNTGPRVVTIPKSASLPAWMKPTTATGSSSASSSATGASASNATTANSSGSAAALALREERFGKSSKGSTSSCVGAGGKGGSGGGSNSQSKSDRRPGAPTSDDNTASSSTLSVTGDTKVLPFCAETTSTTNTSSNSNVVDSTATDTAYSIVSGKTAAITANTAHVHSQASRQANSANTSTNSNTSTANSNELHVYRGGSSNGGSSNDKNNDTTSGRSDGDGDGSRGGKKKNRRNKDRDYSATDANSRNANHPNNNNNNPNAANISSKASTSSTTATAASTAASHTSGSNNSSTANHTSRDPEDRFYRPGRATSPRSTSSGNSNTVCSNSSNNNARAGSTSSGNGSNRGNGSNGGGDNSKGGNRRFGDGAGFVSGVFARLGDPSFRK